MVINNMSMDTLSDPVSSDDSYKFIFSDNHFLQHEAYKVSEDTILALPLENRLRRDGFQTIYYGVELFDVWICRLCSEQVICLSLFDGKRSLGEIAKILSELSGCNQESSLIKLRYFLYRMNYSKNHTFINCSNSVTTKQVKTFNYEDYIHDENKLTLRLDAPTSLILMPTDKCLTDCEYCYACRRQIPTNNLLSVKRILELIGEANELGIISINVDGGDIFARPEHMKILERMLSYDIDPGISTKGYISKEKAKELKKIGLKWLQVGLDSTREMCDKLVCRPGYFDRIVETIHNLDDAGISVRTNSIITRESLHLLPDLVDFLMTLPLFDIKVAPAFLGFYRGNEQMLLTALQKTWYRKIMEEKVLQYPDHKINWECEEDILDATKDQINGWFTSRPYCSSGRTQIVIAPDGKVVTCEQSPQEGEFVCGDVTHQSIMDVWDSDILKKWYEPAREEFRETACYDCEEFEPCIHGMGHCWLQNLKMQGRPFAPHPYCPKSQPPKQRWR